MPLISLVVPCYNEAESIPLFQAEAQHVLELMQKQYGTPDDPMSFEIIYVDDGSTDDTLSIIRNLSSSNTANTPCSSSKIAVSYISFSRNFGKEAAIIAGLDAARGEYVATMDADLQDPPSLLSKMYGMLISSDADNVAARRVTRKGEPPIRSFFARMFYKLINRLSDTEIVDGARDYRLMSRRMVSAICSMRETNRFSKGIFGWVGFKTKWLEYENVERAAGETKWSLPSLFAYSIEGIVAFSTKPLNVASVGGILFCLLAFVFLVAIVVRTLIFGDPVDGWPSLACIILFVGGSQMLCMGIFGKYLAKAYLEVKARPIYIVKDAAYLRDGAADGAFDSVPDTSFRVSDRRLDCDPDRISIRASNSASSNMSGRPSVHASDSKH